MTLAEAADVTVTETTFAELAAAVLELASPVSAGASCWPFWSSASRFAPGSFGLKNAVQFAAIVFWVGVSVAAVAVVLAGVLAAAELDVAELDVAELDAAGGVVVELELLQAARAAHSAPARSNFRSALTAVLRLPARLGAVSSAIAFSFRPCRASRQEHRRSTSACRQRGFFRTGQSARNR
jgi:hypothetical protein